MLLKLEYLFHHVTGMWWLSSILNRYIITGMTQEGLFRVNGSMKMVEQLRLQYERGEEVELVKDGDVYAAASLLKLFLRELPDGIITSALHPRFIQLYQGK